MSDKIIDEAKEKLEKAKKKLKKKKGKGTHPIHEEYTEMGDVKE